MTVWIYVDARKKVGDVDHLKVFASEKAAERWFADHDPEGVAFEIRSQNKDHLSGLISSCAWIFHPSGAIHLPRLNPAIRVCECDVAANHARMVNAKFKSVTNGAASTNPLQNEEGHLLRSPGRLLSRRRNRLR